MQTITLTVRPAYHALSTDFTIPSDIVVRTENMDILETFPQTVTGYNDALRFIRLIERGYAPQAARMVNWTVNNKPASWKWWVEPSLHDGLTDEIPPVIPAGYEVELFSIDELASSELDHIVKMWKRDGEEALYIAAEDFCVEYNEIRAYVHGRVQSEDEENDNWVRPHHSELVSY